MGIKMNHPSPAHSPSTTTELGLMTAQHDKKWSSLVRRANSPTITESFKSWRPTTSHCNCKLSIRPNSSNTFINKIDIATVLYYAHQYGDFAKAHADFESVKEKWTPEMFGLVLQLIHEAQCHTMDQALRTFHQAIRNNGLWTNWIESSSQYPHFESILLEELAAVIENLSPKYLKDIKIQHLLKIFPSSDGKTDVQLHGKKRKLKRQVLKWCETQSEDILNMEWENINTLKWRLQSVIDYKDKEMEERLKAKHNYQHNWRSTPFPAAVPKASQRFSLSDKNNWPTLQSHWTPPHENRLVMGM